MRLLLLFLGLLFFSCANDSPKDVPSKKNQPDNGTTTKPSHIKKVEEEPLVTDTGQTWFRVSITKNDSPFIKFNGTWPVLQTTEGFATLAFTASKGALVVSNGITFYMYGWPITGRAPIVYKAVAGKEINMIMVPVKDGAYSLAISADTGFVDVTKNDGKKISGNFEAHAIDADKNVYQFKGQFLNVKPR
jgi:hypothetical protein